MHSLVKKMFTSFPFIDYVLLNINKMSRSDCDCSDLLHGDSNILTTVKTLTLVHKHVKISVDEWVMETTRPHKQVKIVGL